MGFRNQTCRKVQETISDPAESRTLNLLLKRELLYQLSYRTSTFIIAFELGEGDFVLSIIYKERPECVVDSERGGDGGEDIEPDGRIVKGVGIV